MKTIYQCELCEACYSLPQDAFNCEIQGFNPKYEIEQKVRCQDLVVVIKERMISACTHRFSYIVRMFPEDNPGKVQYAFRQLISEDNLFPLCDTLEKAQ